MSEPIGRYSRGYLPHVDLGAHSQFLTWRLADALPLGVLRTWEDQLKDLAEVERRSKMWRMTESFLDGGFGSQILAGPPVARIVQESLFHGHGIKYVLHHWVIMPNHVHVLLTPVEGALLRTLLQVSKGFTAKEINRLRGDSGQVWQADYFDRWIRDDAHFQRTAEYIEWNPVKAKLVADPKLCS